MKVGNTKGKFGFSTERKTIGQNYRIYHHPSVVDCDLMTKSKWQFILLEN
jgi:hypothetical protein